MTAIPFSIVGHRSLVDDTLRITIDVEPMHAKDALALFYAHGTPGAMSALKTAGQTAPAPPPAEEPEKLSGGPIARWLGIRCSDPVFRSWVARRWPAYWHQANGQNDCAAEVVRQ